MIDFRKIRFTLRELERVWTILKEDGKQHYFEQYYIISRLLRCKDIVSLSSWIDMVQDDIRLLHTEFDNQMWKTEKSVIFPICCLVRGLFPEERIVFLKALRIVREQKGFRCPDLDCFNTMEEETIRFHQKCEDGVLLFQGTLSCYMAFGRSAELLYEKLGWQITGYYSDVEGYLMFLSEYSLVLIGRVMKYEVSPLMLDFDLVGLVDEEERELEFSLEQQAMDYFRFLSAGDDLHLPTMGRCETPTDNIDLGNREVLYPSLKVSEKEICLYDIEAQTHQIVSGHSWLIGPDNLSLARKLADVLYMHFIVEKDGAEPLDCWLRKKGVECIDAFYHLKDKYPESVLMVDYRGTIMSYGDDAVWLAWHYHIPLWCRAGNKNEVLQTVIIPDDVVTKVLEEEPKAILEQTKITDTVGEMAIWPNALNHGLQDDTQYKTPRVYKRKDGEYVVRATLDGKPLPERVLKKEMVTAYENYPDGIMKAAVLKQILWYAYTENNDKKLRKQ